MRDLDVRSAVHATLCELHRGDENTYVVDEMGLWAGTVRIDIAVINGEFHGFELKSARDTLSRLAGQAEIYNQVFDKVTLVTAQNHFVKAERLVPEWWGIITAIPTAAGPLRLIEVRPPQLNPSINATTLSRILWRSEISEILERHNLLKGFRSKAVDVLARRLAEELSLEDLRNAVRASLKSRSVEARTVKRLQDC